MEAIIIDMKLPSLNDYIQISRTNKYKSASFKKNIEKDLKWFLIKMKKYNKPIRIHFHWVEGNKKRDYDNIAFAKKFILDTMVKMGKIKDDNRNCVVGFTDTFSYDKDFRVLLKIEEVNDDK